MRLNARLDDSYEEKFKHVQLLSNKNRTEVLKEALDMYFSDKLKKKEQDAWEDNQKILAMIGGIATGSEDLSENYKEHIYQGLKQKYDID